MRRSSKANGRAAAAAASTDAAEDSNRYDTAPYEISGRGLDKRLPRLVVRDVGSQSSNIVQVVHGGGEDIWKLQLLDWYHTFLRRSTLSSMLFLLGVWTAMILVFAGAYMAIDNGNETFCGLGKEEEPIQFGPAFAFSLETW